MSFKKALNINELMDLQMVQAIKSSDKVVLDVIRIIKTALIKEAMEKVVEMSKVDYVSIFKVIKKKLEKEIDALEKSGQDTTDQKRQLEYVEGYLPKMTTEADIRFEVEKFFKANPNSKKFRVTMRHLKDTFGDLLDVKVANKTVKAIIQGE